MAGKGGDGTGYSFTLPVSAINREAELAAWREHLDAVMAGQCGWLSPIDFITRRLAERLAKAVIAG